MRNDLLISNQFDGANIDIINAQDPNDIQLAIRKDNTSDFLQWFSFRVYAPKGTHLHIRIINARETSYTKGWKDYKARYSYDEENWLQADTSYDNELRIQLTMEQDSVSFAYFAPYSLSRHQQFIRWCNQNGATLRCLGKSVQGRTMDLLRVGQGEKQIWCIARQHPGETMAQWWMEGFCTRLLQSEDPIAHALKKQCTLHLVPNMNPDGSFLGNLRTNAAGANLNREWSNPTIERSPEVFYVRQEMERTGVNFALDVHGDEGLPYNFFAGPDGIPSFDSKKKHVLDTYSQLLLERSPDFQTEYGYPKTPPGKANMSVCSSYVSETFNCVAITLEQPFKDNAANPMPDVGWSPQRAQVFGAACLASLLPLLKDL